MGLLVIMTFVNDTILNATNANCTDSGAGHGASAGKSFQR